MKFTHLHVHSHYSLLDGLSKIDDIIERAQELEMDSIALTDHGVLYGSIEFYKKAKKAGIKPILGVEAYIAPNGHQQKRSGIDNKRFHLILLAQNETGWRNIITLVNTSHLEGFYYKPRMDLDLLRKHNEGIVCLSGCLSGQASRALREGDTAKARTLLKEYSSIFPGRFFVEVQSHPHIPDSDDVTEQLIELAREMNLPLVATQDSHYTRPEDAQAHDVLLAVQTGNQIGDSERLTLKDDDFSIKSAEEMAEAFKHAPEAIENTQKVVEMCNIELELGKVQLPEFELPEGETADSYLRNLSEKGLTQRYKEITNEHTERLNYELSVIEKTGYAGYFLIVQDFVNWAKDHGIVVGPGRGSAAGSLVSYCLNITEVDPLRYDLLFERFLNPDRIQMPDIDIDFTDIRRDEVLAYIKQRYGEDHVAQIITFGTMAARAAIRDAGRALGYPYGLCDRIAKLIPFATGLQEALDTVEELKKEYNQNDEVKHVLNAALKLEGVVRHASVHACGTVIASESLLSTVPLQRAPQDDTNIITQFEMHAIEDLGLLKMDLLGLRNLTIIEEALRIIRERANENIDIRNLPLDDEKTFDLFRAAETIGVFQLESDGMRRYIKELQPTELEDIIAMIALYRPGPMDLIPQYIARKHGQAPIRYIHPKLEPILGVTYGVGIYQEQMMRIARDLAGFSLAEADTLRKAIGKKIKELLDEMQIKLINGMVENGIDRATAKEIWELFPPFARYGFNKSHATAYATVSYQTAYLKANYPVEFVTSLFRAEAKDTERTAFLIKEANRMGIEILPPDINQSMEQFSIDDTRETPAIRFGLSAVKNVGEAIVEAVIQERRANGPFSDLQDLLVRVHHKDLNRKSIESLTKCGALDSLGIERGQVLENLDTIIKFNNEQKKSANNPQGGLFDTMEFESAKLILEDTPPADEKDILTWEKELLGIYVSNHPLEPHRAQLDKLKIKPIAELDPKSSRTVRIAGVISQIKRIITKNGKPMAFATIEDMSSSIEILVFNEALQENPEAWEADNVVVINGRPSNRPGEFKLICKTASKLS